MTEPEAYKIATKYLAERSIAFSRCFSRRLLDNAQASEVCGGDYPIVPGNPQKVWEFGFIFEEAPPNVVMTGNHCLIYIDDDTHQCGYWVAR